MKKSDQLLETYREYLNANNATFLHRVGLDSTITEAKDALLRDDRGREFVDFVAGYGVFNLGHNPPQIIDALRRELDGFPLWNRPFLSEPLAHLAAKLVELTPGDLNRVFVCSTGAEAVESAIKLARLATRRSEIVAAEGGFHGFTLGALSVSGIPGQSRPFKPLLPGVRHVPFGDAEALEAAVSNDTAAVLLEPFQAEIGAATPSDGYLAAAREICDSMGALLIIDEVRTGMGRTGPLFAVERERVVPDVLVIGKSLSGGIVPIGAIIARSDAWGRFGLSFSMSASSFAGNRLACVSALAALTVLEDEKILEAGRTAAETLWAGLNELASDHSRLVTRLTGKGMLVGLHLQNNRVTDDVVTGAIARGLLVGAAFCNGRCILIEPPLVIGPAEIRRGLDALGNALDEAASAHAAS
jgi:putrescine aminotransferase